MIAMILIVGCTSRTIIIPKNASSELIKEFNQKINSREDAKNLLQNWLYDETDFDPENNKIEYVDEYPDYYNLRLTTTIKIKGRVSGVIGYRDYKVSRDGKLYGYYYSK